MRLSRTEVARREGFVLDLFMKFPSLSAAEANKRLMNDINGPALDGLPEVRMMRPKRIYELRKQARTHLESLQPASVG